MLRPSQAPVDPAAHEAALVALLSELLSDVATPEFAGDHGGSLDGTASRPVSASNLARTIQAQGIHFQLVSIAEQNAAMQRRRQIEIERGYENLRGTFAQVIA